MQTIQRAYSQRVLCGSLSIAMGGAGTAQAVLAHGAMPNGAGGAWGVSHASAMTNSAVPSTVTTAAQAVSNFSAAHSMRSINSERAGATMPLFHNWQQAAHPVPNFATQAARGSDINLGSAQALFTAGSLAGFRSITLDIGGRQQQINFDSKLTGAELVAAQQVLSGAGQNITINARGVATGGNFDLSNSTLMALNTAVGGNIGTLHISRGVQAIDTLSNLSLAGSLINYGSIVVGAEPGAGHSVDVINASNIYNAYGGSIISAAIASALVPTGIELNATGAFVNSGHINSSSVLNISAATIYNGYTGTGTQPAGQSVATLQATQNVNLTSTSITNAGLISSTNGNVNFSGGTYGGDINVLNALGTVQALNGNINFNGANYAGISNINIVGGDWLSKQMNFNAHEGTIEANVGQVTGQINGEACLAHITADTQAMSLGGLNINGDPTYYNTGGDIIISSPLTTGGADLAIVASGNIIGNGGSLNTANATKAGTITLIAGALIQNPPAPADKTVGPDSGTTLTILNGTVATGNGSATGGYIDLSGTTENSKSGFTPITAFNSSSSGGSGGNVLMVAYRGTTKGSGDIVTPGFDGTFNINSSGLTKSGSVTMIGGGTKLYTTTINGGDLAIIGGTPQANGVSIKDGTLTGNFTVASGAPVNVANVAMVGYYHNTNVNIDTKGEVNLSGQIITAGRAGAGGVTGTNGGKGGDGQNGGNISITGSGLFLDYLDTTGGGGGGGAPGADGGAGGKAGNVSLVALSDNIQLFSQVNATGGGGGGGGGQSAAGTFGAGGVGGGGGNVTITTPFAYVAANVSSQQYASIDTFNGGNGGAGGVNVAGKAGGGGGAGGGSYGAGGGGGAAGTDTGAAGGGGGGGGLTGGGGGGGTLGAGDATGGYGGSDQALLPFVTSGFTPGFAGTGSGAGTNGQIGSSLSPYRGGAGGGTGGGGGGAGGVYAAGGAGGLGGATGLSGGPATGVGGTGSVALSIGAATGTLKAPVIIGTANLTVQNTDTSKNAKAASVFVGTYSDAIKVGTSTFKAGNTFQLDSYGGSVAVTGPITGASIVNINAQTDLTVSANMSAATSINLHSTKGDLVNSVGSITAPTLILRADAGKIIATTNTDTLTVAAKGSTVNITEGASTKKATTLLASSVGVGGTFTVTSSQQLNVTGIISADQGTVNLTESGTSPIGLNLTASPAVGNTGKVNLTTTGTGSINVAKLLSAQDITIVSGGAVGSATKPLLTNALKTITVTENGAESVFIKDSNTNALTFSGTGKSISGITLVSAAKNLTVPNLLFANVNIQNTYNVAGQTSALSINPLNVVGQGIGTGLGSVSIKTALASIESTSKTLISGTKVTLSSTAGDIGKVSTVFVSTPALSVNAPKGMVVVTDIANVVLSASAALNNFSFTSVGNMTVSGAINGSTVNLATTAGFGGNIAIGASIGSTKTQNVTISSAGSISQTNAKAVMTGTALSISAKNNIGSGAQSLLTKSTSSIVITGGGTSQSFIGQTGNVTLGTASGMSFLRFANTGSITIGGVVNPTALEITTPSLIMSGAGAINATSGIQFHSPAAISITGTSGSIKGSSIVIENASGAKPITAVTLGDAKTGAGNPLDFAMSNANSGTSTITVTTVGNFTSALTKIATNTQGSGGNITITAKNLVSLGTTNGPIIISADAKSGSALAGGVVKLNLTGTQAVTVDNDPSAAKIAAPYFVTARGGSGGGVAGSVSVQSGGNLTLNAGGFDLGSGLKGGSVSLLAAKNLVVADMIGAAASLAEVTLSSGSTSSFVVNTGATVPVNGTAGKVVADNVSINAGGPIIVNGAGDIKANSNSYFTNNLGNLTIIGPGTIDPGTSLLLTAKGSINLGDVKNLGVNNPLSAAISSKSLDTLTITAGGNLTSGIGDYSLNVAATGGYLYVQAANVINLAAPLAPIGFHADGTNNGGTLYIAMTGAQTITLGNTAVLKGQPQFDISSLGPVGGNSIINVFAKGVLIVSDKVSPLAGNDNQLSLIGTKGLSVLNPNLLNSGLSTLELNSGAATPFVVGAAALSKDLNNGTAGPILAKFVKITDVKGITVNSGANGSITGTGSSASLSFDTANLLNNGSITGGGVGSFMSMVAAGTNSIGVSAIGTGTFNNIESLVMSSGSGSVSVGNLFAPGKNLDGVLSGVSITAKSSINFSGTGPAISVLNGGTIDISEGSLVSAAAPITFKFGAGDAGATGILRIANTGALIIGSAKGNVAVAGGNVTSTISSGALLTVTGNFNPVNYQLTGSSVAVKGNLGDLATSTGAVFATGKSGTITVVGGSIFANTLTMGQGATALAKTPISVSGGQLLFGGQNTGALNISNSRTGSVIVSFNSPVTAFTYTGAVGSTTLVNSLATTAGAINVTTGGDLSTAGFGSYSATGGGINLIAGQGATASNLSIGANGVFNTNGGSILFQNLATTAPTISLANGVTAHASATAKGVGQVSIVNGALPALPTAGTAPANAPTVFTTGGAGVFYTDGGGQVTAVGTNTLNAFGRNVVFNANTSKGGSITINNVVLTADPPVDGAASIISPVVGGGPLSLVNTQTLSAQPETVTAGGGIARAFADATSALPNLAAISNANINNATVSASTVQSQINGGGLRLTGEVSNLCVKELSRGPVLIAPDKDTIVKTTFGSVKVAEKSVALIVAFDGGIAVYNLHDSKRGAVVVEHEGRAMNVMPGQNAVVTRRDVRFFEEVNPASFVGYRRMVSRVENGGVKTFRGEFNIFSLIGGCAPLKDMIKSQEPGQQKMVNSMLKTAAILLTSGSSVPYQQMNVPSVTAMRTENVLP